MSRHEVLWSTTYSDNGADQTLTCVAEGCGWEIAITETTEVGAKRAAREHTELHATIKAKQENDERFMLERDEARRECDQLRLELSQMESGAQIAVNAGVAYSQELYKTRRERDRLRHEAKLQRSDLVQWVRDYERARTRINELTVMNEAMSKDVAFLGALEAAGVDNWEGYEIAQEIMKEESEQ